MYLSADRIGVSGRDGEPREPLGASCSAASLNGQENPRLAASTRKQLEHAMTLQRRGNFVDAGVIYRTILANEPDNPDALHLFGLVLGEQDRHAEAVSHIERALELRPDAAPFHHNLGGIYRRLGRTADAVEAFRRAVALKPDYGEAYQGLAESARLAPDDPLAERAHTALADPELDDTARSFLHFALGKFYDDNERFDPAFEHYRSGNALAGRAFDAQLHSRQVRYVLFEFSPRRARALDRAGDPSELPVFVVGMPRSGTTLVEQILASHSQVHGAGELPAMRNAVGIAQQRTRTRQYAECVAKLSRADIWSLAGSYLEAVRPHAAQPGREAPAQRVVDKHPLNFQLVGLIFLMFPKARIVHTVRHPLDTCLSCFFQHFTRGQDYTFNLDTLGVF